MHPIGCWSLTSDGGTHCPVAGCDHIEPATSGVSERQYEHERDAHDLHDRVAAE